MINEFPLNSQDWEVLAVKAVHNKEVTKAISYYENASRHAVTESEKVRLQRCADEIKIISNT